jgi:hypothetical protein
MLSKYYRLLIIDPNINELEFLINKKNLFLKAGNYIFLR